MTCAAPSDDEADYLARVDPELREAYPLLIADLQALFLRDVEAAKAAHRGAQARRQTPFVGTRKRLRVPGMGDDPEINVTMFAANPAHADCAIIWLHGGGYWAGSADLPSAHVFAGLAPVYSVAYRLAPDHHAPAPARDVCAVLDWLAGREHPRKVIIAGESAGAGLAASAAIMNRDRSGPALALQLLFYPALDHRLDTASARQPMPAQFGSRAALEKAWSIYLGGKSPDCYAAAACAEDLTALPPAHLAVGALDLLHDECVAYADRLERAGVAVELQVYDGAPHGFDHIAPDATVSKHAHANAERAIRDALAQ